jgi:hypothetical protein
LELRREKVDERENGAEPMELGGEIHEWTTAINAGDTRVSIEEPIQSGVQTARVKDGRSAEERKVSKELGKAVRDKERIWKSSSAKRSRRKGSRLDDSRSDGK